MKRIYLDNHTASEPSSNVVKSMLPFLKERFASPYSPYTIGQDNFTEMKEGYKALYTLLGAKEEDSVIFCASGAEAINHVLFSTYLDVTKMTGKNHFVTSIIDEAAVIMTQSRLEKLGCVAKLSDVEKNGVVSAKNIREAISPRTAIVSLSWANGLTGVIHPVLEISKICQERNILFHLDATHVLGKHFFDLDEIKPDFITFDGEPLHAPKGSAGLYIRSGLKISPFIVGGHEQGGLRAGSVNLPAFIGLSTAAKELLESRDLMCTEIARLRDKFEHQLALSLKDISICFHDEMRLPNCSAIIFEGVSNEALLYLLNRRGLYATFGGGSFQKISLILQASKIDEALSNSALSFALSRDATDEEIDNAVDIIVSAVKQLRKVSGHL